MATPKKPCFADGGQISKADQMIADINAKYGVSGKSAPAPTPAPAPAPPPPKEAPGSMLQKAAGLFGDRAKQIDKASGFRNGGKITGPGTATSDSIPATVAETGEDIQVSNTERIISAKQEILLAKIANMLGFESVDAMLEAGTGTPVGPTVKGGKKAAADGMSPEEKDWRLSTGNIAGPYAPNLGKDIGDSVASVLPVDSPLGQMLKSGTQNNPSPPPADQKLTLPATPQMSPDPNNAVPRLLAGAKETYPQNTPTTYKPEAPAPKPEITAGMDSKQNYGPGPGAEANAVLERANKARGGLIESMIAANGGNGVAILPDRTNEINLQMDLNKLSPEERVKYQLAQQASDNTQRGQDLTNQAEMARNKTIQLAQGKDPLDQQIKGLQVKDQEQMAMLRGRLLDPNASAADRATAAATIRALSGKTEKETGKFGGHVVKGQIGEPDTFVTWDERTGQPVFAGTGLDVAKSVQAKTVGGSPHAEGTRLKGPDGKAYIVKNGQPVLAQ